MTLRPPQLLSTDLLAVLERAGQTAPKVPRGEVVLIVHGTYANPEDSPENEVPWWKSHGSFAKALDTALERHGSAARCRTGLATPLLPGSDLEIERHWDGWSGANSEVARRQAAFQLAEHLRALQENDSIRAYHIVAHSHGGNVALRALRYLKSPGYKRGRIVCLGTPFLHFSDRAAWRRWIARVHWPMVAVLALISLALASLVGEAKPDQLHLYALALLGGGALVEIWRYARTSEINSQVAPAVGVRFAKDEAIQLLRSCAALTAEPHLFLRDVLGGTAPRRPWMRGKSRFVSGWFDRATAAVNALGRAFGNAFVALSNFWNGPLCRGIEAVTSLAYRVPFLGPLGSILLLLLFRPYRPPLRPFVASRMPRLSALFFHSFEKESRRMFDIAKVSEKPWLESVKEPLKGSLLDPDTVQTLVAGLAALLYLPFHVVDKILGLPAWLGAVTTRFAILAGARAAAEGATGMDMLGAAFRLDRTGTPPDAVQEVVIPSAIEEDLEESLQGVGRVDVRGLRDALDPARRAMLLQAVETAFTDVGLLHAQYYQDPRVIDYVAQRIAGEDAAHWVEDAAAVSEDDSEE